MKKLLVAATALSGLLALTSVAKAADPVVIPAGYDWYLSIFGAYTFMDDYEFDLTSSSDFGYEVSMDDGFLLGGAIGFIYNENVRFDVEVAYGENDFGDDYEGTDVSFDGDDEEGDIHFTTILANVWLNAQMMDYVDPYVGGGVGVGFVDGDLSISNGSGDQLDGSDTVFAAQLGAGLRFPVSDSFEIDLGYRFRALFDAEIDSAISGFDASKENIYVHSAQLGVNFKF